MAEISWNQLQSVIRNLKEIKIAADKLLRAYSSHQVQINNRINILAKKNYELQLLTNTASGTIARELTRLRAIRAEQNALKRRDPAPVQQNPVRPKSKPGAKRPAKRIDATG